MTWTLAKDEMMTRATPPLLLEKGLSKQVNPRIDRGGEWIDRLVSQRATAEGCMEERVILRVVRREGLRVLQFQEIANGARLIIFGYWYCGIWGRQ